jgi:hypothetical protein
LLSAKVTGKLIGLIASHASPHRMANH